MPKLPFRTMGWSPQHRMQVPGYKVCPMCDSTDIHFLSSSLHVDSSGRYFNQNENIPPGFPTYGSWRCLTCNRSFEAWKFKPEAPNFNGELKGIDRATF